jgi:tryptophan synthase alpha chain
LLPYFTSGFPDQATTAELIVAADAVGASVIELGVPYSDSIADGPVIQSSFNYALARGHRVGDVFDVVHEVRPSVGCALTAMLSYSIVHRVGVERFMERAAAAGFDGIILPDVPQEEAGPTSAAARSAGLCHIGLIAPTTSPARRETIAREATGFLYQIAAAGTTGERAALPATLADEVAVVRRHTRLPICVGFGISNAAQVRAVGRVADGVIIGSAIIRRIDDAAGGGANSKAIVAVVTEFLAELSTGLSPPTSTY